jgi:hypothetical protein
MELLEQISACILMVNLNLSGGDKLLAKGSRANQCKSSILESKPSIVCAERSGISQALSGFELISKFFNYWRQAQTLSPGMWSPLYSGTPLPFQIPRAYTWPCPWCHLTQPASPSGPIPKASPHCHLLHLELEDLESGLWGQNFGDTFFICKVEIIIKPALKVSALVRCLNVLLSCPRCMEALTFSL